MNYIKNPGERISSREYIDSNGNHRTFKLIRLSDPYMIQILDTESSILKHNFLLSNIEMKMVLCQISEVGILPGEAINEF